MGSSMFQGLRRSVQWFGLWASGALKPKLPCLAVLGHVRFRASA